MEKIVRNFKIDYYLDWTYGIDISKLRADLDAVEKLGATHIEIEHRASYDSSYIEIDAIANRIETDEECSTRLAEMKHRQDEQTRREREQFEKLKSKYGQ